MLALIWLIVKYVLLLAFVTFLLVEDARGLCGLLTDFRRKLVPEFPTAWQRSRLFRAGVVTMPVLAAAGVIFWSLIAFALLCQFSKAAMALA